LWHAGPERPIPRPPEPDEHHEDDRGKPKCHPRHNRLVLNETWQVGFLSHTDAGNGSEKRLAELAGYAVPPGSSLDPARGFPGCCLQDVTRVHPKNTPRGGERTPPERAPKRRIASIRIRLEHAIGGVKRDRIVKDNIRLLTDGIRDAVMEPGCGWQTLRLQYRPWC
jgi:hypothetical protein